MQSNFKNKMKKGIHPDNYRFVVMKDMSTGFTILTKSTADTKETVKWKDGKDYPLIKMEISSDSHPFYTGKMKLVDTAGRIDKFKNKYSKFSKPVAAVQEEAPVAVVEEVAAPAVEETPALEAAAQAKEESKDVEDTKE